MHPRSPAILIALLFAAPRACPPALAQPPEAQDPPSSNARAFQDIAAIGQEVAKLGDWEAQYARIETQLDDFWAENGWTDEADLFARDTAKQVAAIPPWEFPKRLEALTAAVQQRYDLDEAQQTKFRGGMYRMIGSLAFRHAGTMMQQTREAVGLMMNGETFTSDQVARWSKESAAVFRDARLAFETMATDMAETFTPAQREIFLRDMQSYHRRAEAVDKLRERWERGEWRPEEWGLGGPADDQPAGSPSPLDPNAVGAKTSRVSMQPLRLSIACDETAWARYVRLFIARHELDEAQAQTAWSILREVEQRAADYRRTHAEQLDQVPPAEREKSEAYAPIRRLFAELEHRLNPIPTEAQRRRADAANPQPPPSASAPRP